MMTKENVEMLDVTSASECQGCCCLRRGHTKLLISLDLGIWLDWPAI